MMYYPEAKIDWFSFTMVDFPEPWFAIERGALNLAIDFARVRLEQFEVTLLPIVERLVPRSEARDVVRILVRGH